MGRPLTEILWQLERKRKYRWSWGTNRTFTIAKAVTLVLLMGLSLIYLSISSSVLDAPRSKMEFLEETSKLLEEQQNKRQEPHRSAQGDFYAHKNFRNISMPSTNDVFNELQPKNISTMALNIIQKLASIFRKADMDHNELLNSSELAKWIHARVLDHFNDAMKKNFDNYFAIDENPRNGLVSWEEYVEFFFKSHNIKSVTASDVHNRTQRFNQLPQNIKVEIARIQARWSEAASNDPEYLTVDEFLAFEHPEASPTIILNQVEDTLATFDLDGDGVISKLEFDTTYREAEGVDAVYRIDKQLIDTDGNGEISRVELMRYMDPRNMIHSEKDAKELLKVADKDKDERLSLLEMVQNANAVIKSKFYDAAKNLHAHDHD